MQATNTATNEFLALDHPFRAEWLVLFGLTCAVILIWTLYRERSILGAPTMSLFAVLRIAALTAAFWMLLGPTSVVEKSTTTRKSIVILTDASASMTTIDPAGTADDFRWSSMADSQVAQSRDRRSIGLVDRAIVSLGISHRELTGAVDAMQQHGAESIVAERLKLANRAIVRCQTHLQDLRKEISGPPLQPLIDRLQRLLISPEFDSLGELVDTLHQGRTPKEAGWRDALPDWIGRVASTSRVLHEFAELMQQQLAVKTDSGSVVTSGVANQARNERVANFLQQFEKSSAASIRENADLRWSVFDQSARDFRDSQEAIPYISTLADRQQLAKQTNLTAALQHLDHMHRDQPIAATFLMSDVAHNEPDARKPADVAAQLGSVPVYMIPIGNELRLRDIDLLNVSAPTVAMRNDDVVIEAYVSAYQCAGESCTVQLLRGGEVVDFRNVLIDSNAETRSVQFQQRVAEIGTAKFQIAVQPLGGEMTTENNFDEIEINVTRSEIKVLLADGIPRWEYRYLAQLFRRDPKIELDELLFRPRMIATGQRQSTKAFPVTVDEWDHYDVVILGDLPVEQFPVASQESLLQYLRTRSGTVIMIAGQLAMPHAYVDYPLQSIVPVRPIDEALEDQVGQFSFQVTDAGKSHAALMIGETQQATRSAWEFVNEFSPLDQVSRWRTPLPTAQSLISVVPHNKAVDESDPQFVASSFLCWQPIGRGRIIYLSGPDTYRLRFLRGDRLHYRFWGQMMRWAIASDLAAGNRLVRIRTTKSLYETDQPVDIEVILLDAAGTPVANDADDPELLHLRLMVGDQIRTVPLVHDAERPGHYRADIRDLSPGVYQAQPVGSVIDGLVSTEQSAADENIENAVATFTVQADLPSELVDTRVNRVLASQVAGATGGQVLPPTAIDEVLALTDLDPVVTHTIEREPMWSRWWYLWLVFGCLQTEWIIRKWRGLS